MNQHQRKFLLEAVEKQYKDERDALRKRMPAAPALNNYLIAAILDGSFVMVPPETVRASIRKRVHDLGKGQTLVNSRGRHHYAGDTEDEDSIQLPATLLFEEPPSYAVAREDYEKRLAAWEAEEAALEVAIGAMRIKVQIGSDKALDALVEQADKLCSMSLTASNQLLLGSGK